MEKNQTQNLSSINFHSQDIPCFLRKAQYEAKMRSAHHVFIRFKVTKRHLPEGAISQGSMMDLLFEKIPDGRVRDDG